MTLPRLVVSCLLSSVMALPALAHAPAGSPVVEASAEAPLLARRARGKGAATKKKKRASKAEQEAEKKAAEEAAQKAAEEERVRLEEEARKQAEAALQQKLAAEEQKRKEEAERAAEEARKRAEQAASEAAEARGLDARVRRLTDALARTLKRLPGDVRDQSFAVMPFAENGEESKSRQLGLVVSDLVVTNLARDHRVSLTERGQLRLIFEEQALGAMGAVDDKQAAQVGKLAGARALVVGEVDDLGDAFRVGARVVDAESGEVLGADEVKLPKEELIAFSADAVVLRSRSGAAFRSLVAPGWGQLYNREPIKAGIVGGAVGVLALATGVTLTTAAITHANYSGFRPDQLKGVAATQENISATVTGLRQAANAQYTAAAILGGVTAAAWLGGALEAYLSGTDVESLDDALAKN